MPRYNAYLFDLDGTLLNSLNLILASYRHTLEVHGLPARSDEEVLAGLGTPLEVSLGRWAARAEDVPVLVDTYINHNLEVHDGLVESYPGVSELVQELAATGAAMGVVTSKRRRGTQQGLAALGLSEIFPVLVCADDVARAKPDPLPVLQALDALEVKPSQAVFVGDAVHDIEAGRAAGVATVAVAWGSGRPEALRASNPSAWAEDAGALRTVLLSPGPAHAVIEKL